MKERGFVGRELTALGDEPDEVGISRLQNSAEALLLFRGESYVADNADQPWDELDIDAKHNVGREFIRIVELAEDRRARPQVLIEAGLSSLACESVIDAVARYRESLPFLHGEFGWLYRQLERARFISLDTEGPANIVERVGHYRRGREIISGGRVVTADGAELVNRGWDWMRGAGSFEGCSTYRRLPYPNALRRIAELFDFDTYERQAARHDGSDL